MTCRVDEVQTTVNTCVLNETVTYRRQFLAQIVAMLILDVSNDRVPAVSQ